MQFEYMIIDFSLPCTCNINGQRKKFSSWFLHARQELNCKAEKTADPSRMCSLGTGSKYIMRDVGPVPPLQSAVCALDLGSPATPAVLSLPNTVR